MVELDRETMWEATAANERFGASGAVTRLKVCANLQVLRSCERQWKPRLPQAARTLSASGSKVQQIKANNIVKRKYHQEY